MSHAQLAGRTDVPDEEREVLGVEHLDVGKAVVGEDLDLVREDVDEAEEDKGVRDERSSRKLLNVADHGKGCKGG